MGKKKKDDKKKKEDVEDADPKLLLKVVEGVDLFKFWNGDKYIGNYEATREDRKIFMNGKGRYTTADKHVYDGVWKNDDLVEIDEMKFPDRTRYNGGLEKMVLNGQGTYTFNDNERLSSEFVKNRLLGDIYLKDRNDHMWEGFAKEDHKDVILHPVLPYYTALLEIPLRKRIIEEEGEGEFFE